MKYTVIELRFLIFVSKMASVCYNRALDFGVEVEDEKVQESP